MQIGPTSGVSSDRDTDRTPPDSSQDDEVYVENEEGEPRMAGRPGHDDGAHEEHLSDSDGLLDPKIYVPILLVGAVLLVFPESLTSTLGLVLVLIGLFIAAVDVLSAS